MSARLRRKGYLARTVVVKIRDSQFRTVTRSRTLLAPTNSTRTLYRMARALLEKWRQSHASTAIRLIGLGTRNFELREDFEKTSKRNVDDVFDQINQRFGDEGIAHGLALRGRKLN